MLQQELRSLGVPARDLPHAARVASFVIEGLLAHPTSAKQRRGLIRWLLASARVAKSASPR